MSTNLILIVAGVVLILVGLAKLASSQSGGFNLSNFGISIRSRNTQNNIVGDVTSAAAKATKPDWGGIAIAVIGLLSALVGLLKG